MTDTWVIKGDILDPSTRALLGSIHRVQLLLAGQAPLSLGIRPGTCWMSGEPVRSIWSHVKLMVHIPSVPESRNNTKPLYLSNNDFDFEGIFFKK